MVVGLNSQSQFAKGAWKALTVCLFAFIFAGCGYVRGGLFAQGNSIRLLDSDSKSQAYTNHQTIDVEVLSSSNTVAWCMSEDQKVAPSSRQAACGTQTSSLSSWASSAPQAATLSSGEGLKKIYLWTAAENGAINATPTIGSIYLDTTAPTVSFSNTPAGLSGSGVSFSFAGSDVGSGVAAYICQVDSGYTSSCGSPVKLAGLSNGAHSFTVTATDRAGNTSASTMYSWTVTSPASQIVAQIQPSLTTVSQVAFAQAPKFELRDSTGAVVTTGPDATALITLTISAGTGTLLGTASTSAVSGIADFTSAGLNVDLAGTGKVITALKADTRSGTLGSPAMSVATSPFNITPGPASLANSLVTFPSTRLNSLSTGFATLTTRDAAGNLLTTGGLIAGFALSGSGTSEISFGTVTDNGNGTYSTSVSGGRGGTAIAIAGSVGGVALTSLKPTLTVVPVVSASSVLGAASIPMKFSVKLNQESHSDVTFHYQTTNGTALSATDYTATTGDVTIAAGSTSGVFSVSTLTNATLSSAKTYTASITAITGANVSALAPVGTIYSPTLSADFTTGILPVGFNFSRASGGTYFNSSGILQTAPTDGLRVSYRPDTLAIAGTLVEDATINQAIYSEQLDNGAWLKTGGAIAGADINTTATLAPDGSNSSELFREDSSSGLHQLVLSNTYSIPAGLHASASVFVKNAGRDQIRVGFSSGSNYIFGSFNLGGTPSLLGVGASTSAPGTAGDLLQEMQALPNGWYRLTVSGIISTASAQSVNLYVSMSNDAAATNTYAGDGVSGFYLWGTQLELATRASSYIATTSVPGSRGADVLNHTLGSEYQTAHGSWVVQQSYAGALGGGIYSNLFNTSGAGGNYMSYFAFAQPTYVLAGYTSGVNGADLYGSKGFSSGLNVNFGLNKIALSYDSADGTQGYNNGGLAGDVGAGAPPTGITQLTLSEAGSGQANFIRNVNYYPVNLTQSTLLSLTAP